MNERKAFADIACAAMEKSVLLAAAALACAALSAPEPARGEGVALSAGGDFRVRQEIAGDIPGLPGNPEAMMPRESKEELDHIRFRPRVWGRMDFGPYGVYLRVADEVREHLVKGGVPRNSRSYAFPDEVVVDNLYFEGRDLFDGLFDFRIGRQDLFDGRHSVFGLDRLVLDGAAYVGSRSCYADMARFTLKPSDTGRLDVFGLYDRGRNELRWGNHASRGRPMNAIHPGDDCDMDEWGGGIVWSDESLPGVDGRLPYRVYAVSKNTTSYHRFDGMEVEAGHVAAFGAWIRPQLAETLFAELEGAGESVRGRGRGGRGAAMGYAALEWRPIPREGGAAPYARISAYYLGEDWDPMWARAPADSELFQYGTLPGLGFWNNLLYAKATIGADLGRRHAVCAYTGPMWAAENDHAGREEALGGSSYKGFLSAVRYDFPLRLAPKDASGADRIELFGHLLAELFNPGDYYESDAAAWFLRWELTAKF